jgi:hypothetical protein
MAIGTSLPQVRPIAEPDQGQRQSRWRAIRSDFRDLPAAKAKAKLDQVNRHSRLAYCLSVIFSDSRYPRFKIIL